MNRFVLLLLVLPALTSCEREIAPGEGCATPAPKVRRLTRGELDATFSQATGVKVTLGEALAAEDLQQGYFGHDSLQVSTLFADQLDGASATLAKERAAAATCAAGEAERPCAKRILKDLAGMSWRRPVTADETDELLALYDAGRDGEDFATGLALAMQGIFESTGALYRTELGDEGASGSTVRLTQWEIASELSFLATGQPPDDALRGAANRGELSNKEVRVKHLRRLLETPAAVLHLRDFVEQWLGLTKMGKVQKNNEYFPKFGAALRDDMAVSAHKLMESALSSTRGSVAELLTADYTFANDALATFLGSAERPGMAMQRVSMRALPRRGLLTHPALLSVYAHNDDGSPVLRGKLVRTRLLCQEIPPPPPDVVAAVAAVSADATTRERAAAHVTTASCNVCHALMDPIGFGLEGYDGFGEARTMESGKAIDDSGEIIGSDVEGPFKGGVALAAKLSQSKQVGVCATKQLTRFALGRHETEADQCSLDLALAKLNASGTGSLYAALEGVVESDAFVQRTVAR